MAILNLKNSALVLSLKAVSKSNDILADQVGEMIPLSRFIILNIKGIFFTSLLIGEIINLFNLFEEHWKDQSHRMMFVQLDPSAKRVFDMTKLSDIIPVYDSVDKALENLPPVL